MGGGCVKNYQKLRDVIYGRPLTLSDLFVRFPIRSGSNDANKFSCTSIMMVCIIKSVRRKRTDFLRFTQFSTQQQKEKKE